MLFDLLRESTPLALLKETSLMNDDHVLDISEVASYYYERCPREYWTIQDFAPCLPQWPHVFMEWRLPAQINTHGQLQPNQMAGAQFGISMEQSKHQPTRSTMVTDEAAIKQVLYDTTLEQALARSSVAAIPLLAMSPDEVWERVTEEDRQGIIEAAKLADEAAAHLKISHIVSVVLWTYVSPQPPALRYLYRYPLTPAGAIATGDFRGEIRDLTEIKDPTVADIPKTDRPHALSFLHVPLLAIKMFNDSQAHLEAIPDSGPKVRERMVVKPWVAPRA